MTTRQLASRFVASVLCTALAAMACASDHLDSPATVANPQADIGDVYAWTSPEGRRLNLAMTIQGHTFSDKVQYVLHVDSGKVFGHTTASTFIVWRTRSIARSATQTLLPEIQPTRRAWRDAITGFACTPLYGTTLSTITSRGS
jgi:hypothetical protein